MHTDRWLGLSEAARRLGVSPQTLRRWDRIGRLRAERHPLNHYRRYRASVIEAWRVGQAPAPQHDLIGRAKELALLLEARTTTLMLVGPPGVGKTALARAFMAHQPGRHLWYDHADGLGPLGPDVDWLVVDNVRADALPARPAGATRCLLIGQRLPKWTDSTHVHVRPLEAEAAWQLFQRRFPQCADSPQARAWVTAQDGLPLAIEWAASHAAQHGVPIAEAVSAQALFEPALRRLERGALRALAPFALLAEATSGALTERLDPEGNARASGWLMVTGDGVRLAAPARACILAHQPRTPDDEARILDALAPGADDAHAWRLALTGHPQAVARAIVWLRSRLDRWPAQAVSTACERALTTRLPSALHRHVLTIRARTRRRLGDAAGAWQDIEAVWSQPGPLVDATSLIERARQQCLRGAFADAQATLTQFERRVIDPTAHDRALVALSSAMVAFETRAISTARVTLGQAAAWARAAADGDLLAEIEGVLGNVLHGEHQRAQASGAYRRAIAAAESAGNLVLEAIFATYLAVARWQGGAQVTLRPLVKRLRVLALPRHAAFFGACDAVIRTDMVALADAEVAGAGFDADVQAAIAIAGAWLRERPQPPPAGDDSRLMVQLVATRPALTFQMRDAVWRLPGDTVVDLQRRPTLARVAQAVLHGPCDWVIILDQAWPGERVQPAAGERRVRSAIHALRRAGFGPWLITTPAGYRLDPRLQRRFDLD